MFLCEFAARRCCFKYKCCELRWNSLQCSTIIVFAIVADWICTWGFQQQIIVLKFKTIIELLDTSWKNIQDLIMVADLITTRVTDAALCHQEQILNYKKICSSGINEQNYFGFHIISKLNYMISHFVKFHLIVFFIWLLIRIPWCRFFASISSSSEQPGL